MNAPGSPLGLAVLGKHGIQGLDCQHLIMPVQAIRTACSLRKPDQIPGNSPGNWRRRQECIRYTCAVRNRHTSRNQMPRAGHIGIRRNVRYQCRGGRQAELPICGKHPETAAGDRLNQVVGLQTGVRGRLRGGCCRRTTGQYGGRCNGQLRQTGNCRACGRHWSCGQGRIEDKDPARATVRLVFAAIADEFVKTSVPPATVVPPV